jgi:hypothetical protein
LYNSEARFTALVESISDFAIFLLDTKGFVVTWNRGAELMEGYRADEVLGRHFSIFFTKADLVAGRPQQVLEAAARLGRFEETGERLRKDGSIFKTHFWIDALRDPVGNLIGYAKFTRDTTAARQLTAALHATESELQLLIDSVTDHAIIRLDTAGNVATWNSGAAAIAGYSADEIIGKDFSVFYTEKDRRDNMPYQALATAERTGRFEAHGLRVRKDGSTYPSEVNIYAMCDPDETLTGFAKVTRDLTEHRRLEEVEAQSAAKSNFLAHLSHEFRTPLNAIIGFSDIILREQLGTIDIRRYVEYGVDINSSGHHLLELVIAMLDVTRIEAGKLEPQFQPVEFDTLIEGVARMIGPKAAGRQIALDFIVEDELSDFQADPRMLRQCLLNLLDNAIKFSPAGAAVRLAVARDADRLLIHVVDRGKGMRVEDIPLALQPFRQLGEATTHPAEGVGLGLSLVKSFCELHGGSIEISSALQAGTNVTLAFPYPGGPCRELPTGRRRIDEDPQRGP